MKYGYARVSSDTQDYSAQVETLKVAGCVRIFSEKASGKSTNGRPQLAKMLKALLPGDIVVVTKLDRVARLLGTCSTSWANSRTGIAALFPLAILGATPPPRWAASCSRFMSGIAELERDLIRKRCQAGIERAKAKGTKFGRPSALDASQRRKIAERYAAGETMAELAREYE